MPNLIQAPNYRQSDNPETTCGRCRFGGTGECRLYRFPYLPEFVCDSWQEGIQENPHNGVMVALMVPHVVGEVLTANIPNPLPLNELHLTLGYLGKTEAQFYGPEYLRLLVSDFALRWYELKGVINGVGRFNRGDGDTEAFYASFDSPHLPNFRHELAEFLANNGVALKTDHGFTPHITLSYIPKDAAAPIQNLDPIPLNFRDVTIGWGDRLWSIPLMSDEVFTSNWIPPHLPYEIFNDGYYGEMATEWRSRSLGIVTRATGPKGTIVTSDLNPEGVEAGSSVLTVARATDFPKVGEDEPITLSNSQYPQFDRSFAERIKERYPDIWDAGGNIRGNEAFDLWGRARSGDDAPAVLDWIKEREAWSARHYRDGMQFSDGDKPTRSSIAGVVALMKWGTVGELGEARMKAVVNEVAEMMDEEERSIYDAAALQDEGLLKRWGKAVLKALGLAHLTREIKMVESWDGAASNYESTADYCDACLINLNEGERDDWTQSLCKMPIREPGDGSDVFVDKAIEAAAARFNQLSKPASVGETEWVRAVSDAAKTLVKAYEQMDREPPQSILDAARKRAIPDNRRDMLEAVIDSLYEMSLEMGRMCVLHAIQKDGDDLYAIMICEGILYRAEINYISTEGDEVLFGEWEMMAPVVGSTERANSVTVSRAADGRYHYALVSATPFLNRVGEIDSTQLFDSFIEQARSTGEYPRLDFLHFMDDFVLGQSYFLERINLAYVEMGWFDDTPLARSFAQAIMDDPVYWGNSIQYTPTVAPVMEEVADGIYALVYRGGIHRFTSLLPEKLAANLFTMAAAQGDEEMKHMNEQEFDAFMRGTANMSDEQRAAALEQIRTVNRAGASGNYVFRANTSQVEETLEAVPATTNFNVDINLDEAAAQITNDLTERMTHVMREAVEGIGLQLQPLATSIDALTQRVEAIEANQGALSESVAPVVEEHQNRQNDAPAGRRAGALYIPRLNRERSPEAVPTLQAVAEGTVSKIFGNRGR